MYEKRNSAMETKLAKKEDKRERNEKSGIYEKDD